MTPDEKAIELVNTLDNPECAIAVVNEIIKVFDNKKNKITANWDIKGYYMLVMESIKKMNNKETVNYFKSKNLDDLIDENFDGFNDLINDSDTVLFYKDLIKQFAINYSESVKYPQN